MNLINLDMKRVAVVSGKGGVGKTTVAVSLALALARRGFTVGVLDADLTGSNIPDILGRGRLEVTEKDTFIPSMNRGVKYVSLGQIASEGIPVLWDPKDLRSAARQLLERTEWGDLDYIICDFPPGFEAETLELLPLMDYVLIVTTPSALSKSKVERMVEAACEFQIPVLGVVKNMSYFECPSCGAKHRIFAEDHSFEELGIPTIAEFPLNSKIAYEKCINEFPVEAFLEALKHSVLLRKKPKSLKRKLLELIFKVKG
ncbi:MAG: P-loop NTPase [Nitrososphaerales archaeon]